MDATGGSSRRRDRFSIERTLRAALDNTREVYQRTDKEFQTMINQVPSAIPHPDGSLRIQQASAIRQAALRQYREELKRFTDFVVSGQIPDDLRFKLGQDGIAAHPKPQGFESDLNGKFVASAWRQRISARYKV
jgi:hypothetical protein